MVRTAMDRRKIRISKTLLHLHLWCVDCDATSTMVDGKYTNLNDNKML